MSDSTTITPSRNFPTTLRDPNFQDQLLAKIAAGKTIKRSLRDLGGPAEPVYVYDLCSTDSEFASRYERARLAGADALAESVVDIPDEEPDVQRARLKSENIRWLTSKLNPRRYGDSLNLNVSEDVSLRDAMAAARERVVNPPGSQVIEHQGKNEDVYTDSQSVSRGDEDLPDGLGELLK